MLDKWITEQHAHSSDPSEFQPNPLLLPNPYSASSGRAAASSNPYLAYPDLPRVSFEHAQAKEGDDTQSIVSYDLVDDDDIPTSTVQEDSIQQVRCRHHFYHICVKLTIHNF